jgi:hypothetical protein
MEQGHGRRGLKRAREATRAIEHLPAAASRRKQMLDWIAHQEARAKR